MDTKTKILNGTEALFKRHGVRSVTMDDIAKDLGMSKKTLYQYFKNKAEIVFAVTQCHFDNEIKLTNGIVEKAKDPIMAMVNILKATAKAFEEIPTSMIYDIQKYYPKSWDQFHDFKVNYVRKVILNNLEQGVVAGLYRDDMDLPLVAKLRVEQIEMVFDILLFPPAKYNLAKVQLEQFAMFLHGVVTMEGKKRIYQYLNTSDDD